MVERFGSKQAGSKGGAARAKRLSKSERSEIARQAALRRWSNGKEIVPATHDGVLEIGKLDIPCAVLSDGTRILTQFGFLKAVGRSGRPASGRGSTYERRPPFFDSDNLEPFIDADLLKASRPIIFRMTGGSIAHGYRADLLPRACEVYLRARDAGALRSNQARFAIACDIAIRGLAHVGIIALVDEATGYQAERARNALAKILETFISDELRRWVKTFPDDYFKEICRLKGIQFRSDMRLPPWFGHITNNVVYKRLAPAVLEKLQEKNPRTETGRRKYKNFQWLTPGVGHPKLIEHLGKVIGVAQLSDDYEDFIGKLNRVSPIYGRAPLFESVQPEVS